MAKHPYENEINEDTSPEILELCVLDANHTSDTNVLRAAAKAQAEIARRERQQWSENFNAQESARIQAQKFQAGQMEEQLKVATQQATSARNASRAAWTSGSLSDKYFEILRGVRFRLSVIPRYVTTAIDIGSISQVTSSWTPRRLADRALSCVAQAANVR